VVLLISYDLNGHERPRAYAAVKKAIEDGAVDYRRPLFSQWLVETYSTPGEWEKHLLGLMDANDRLFICAITKANAGYLDEEIWTWLNARVRR
jgi:hypothetical protein